jgi:carbon storage regulator CsrA
VPAAGKGFPDGAGSQTPDSSLKLLQITCRGRRQLEMRRSVHFIREELAMLVLSRKLNESVCIADEIEIVIVEVRGKRVRLGFRAPENVSIQRKERTAGSAHKSRPGAQGALAGLAVTSVAGK